MKIKHASGQEQQRLSANADAKAIENLKYLCQSEYLQERLIEEETQV